MTPPLQDSVHPGKKKSDGPHQTLSQRTTFFLNFIEITLIRIKGQNYEEMAFASFIKFGEA